MRVCYGLNSGLIPDLEANHAKQLSHAAALCAAGVFVRFAPESGGSAAYQAMDPGHCDAHLHLKCVGCGRLIHLDTGVSDALQADLLRAAGFTVDGRSTTIYGTCAACGGKRGGHA